MKLWSMIIMRKESLRDALLRGDREAAGKGYPASWKNDVLRELTDAHLRGEVPFCQLTAAAQVASAFPVENRDFAACCGGVAGNTSAIGKNYMLMLLRAWGVPTLDLGMDVPAEGFLRAVEERGLRFVICVGFSAGDAEFVRMLHQRASEHGMRQDFQLLLCGTSLTAETLADLPLDFLDNRTAAVAKRVVDAWTR